MKKYIFILAALAGLAGRALAQDPNDPNAVPSQVPAIPVPVPGELPPPGNDASAPPPATVTPTPATTIPAIPPFPPRVSRADRLKLAGTNAPVASTNRPSSIPKPLRRPDTVTPSAVPGGNNPLGPRGGPGGRNGAGPGAKPGGPVDPNKASAEDEALNDEAVKKARQRDVGALKIKAMPLEQFLSDVYANYAQKTILRGQGLPQLNLTLDTKSDLTTDEMLQAFDTLLALNGISMVPTGTKFVTAVPNANQTDVPPPFANKSAAEYPEAAQYVTHVVQVKHVPIEEAVGVLRQFSKNQNGIVALESTKTIILRDFAINVKRMLEVLEKIDIEVEDDFQLEVIPIKYGKVEEIYSALTSVISGSGGVTGGPGTGGTGGTGAGGLRGGSRGGIGGTGGIGSSGGLNGGINNSYGGSGLNRGGVNSYAQGQNRNLGGTGTTGTGTQGAGSFAQRYNNINRGAGGVGGAGGLAEILQNASITADARSNSLIIYGSKKDIARIKDVLAKVDTLLSQVLIEGIVLSVSVGDGFNFGVAAGQAPKQFNGDPKVVGAGSINNPSGSGGSPLSGISGLATNAFASGSGFTYLAQIGNSWGLTLNAAVNDSRVDIIQRPRILTSHATPASFSVGKSVPFKQGEYAYGVGGTSSYYSQLFVGVQLQVTPYLTPDGLVTMDVTQTIEDLDSAGDTTTGVPPTTTERSATSTVSVMTGDTILLGGYINTTKRKAHSGVPFLQDIPLLGNAFKSHSKQTDRSELMVMLRPTIIKDPRDAARLTGEERVTSKDMRELEKNIGQDARDNREASPDDATDKKSKKK